MIFFALKIKSWKKADICILFRNLCWFQRHYSFCHIFYRLALNRPYVNPILWTFLDFFCGSSLFFDPNFLHLGAFCPQNAESNLKSLYQWKNMKIVEIRGKIFTHIWNLHFFGYFWIISNCHLCRLFSLRVFNLQGMTIPPIDRKFYAD